MLDTCKFEIYLLVYTIKDIFIIKKLIYWSCLSTYIVRQAVRNSRQAIIHIGMVGLWSTLLKK